MELRPITQLERWYREELSTAFPPNERKSLEDLCALMEAGRYQILGLFEEETLLGYGTLWMEPGDLSCILLDYLGVRASCRNQGLGGALLRLLTRHFQGRSSILAEAEVPVPGGTEEENALRRRRMGFYARNGFSPVYEMATCGMRFQTYLGGPIPADLTPVMALHKAIYGPERVDVVIPLGPHQSPPPSLFL